MDTSDFYASMLYCRRNFYNLTILLFLISYPVCDVIANKCIKKSFSSAPTCDVCHLETNFVGELVDESKKMSSCAALRG